MSKPRPHLDNTKATAKRYVKWLKTFPFVKGVFLAGSRAKGVETKDSDWDIVILSDRKVKFPDPRIQFKFNADLLILLNPDHLRDFYKKL